LHLPSAKRQIERLEPRFHILKEALEKRRITLQTDITGIIPEEVLVFEIAGSLSEFVNAVQKIEGMEWLTEIEEEDVPPDEDFYFEKKKEKPLITRLFLVFSNQKALNEMLSLWEKWKKGEELPYSFKSWKEIFKHLKDIRIWGVKDRLIETGILQYWEEEIKIGSETVTCEINLWFRKNSEIREKSSKRVEQLVKNFGGEIIHISLIPEIHYHAMLVKFPREQVVELIKEKAMLEESEKFALFQCEQIQFFLPTGQMAVTVESGDVCEDEKDVEPVKELGEPIAALLDGLPLQNHKRLAGRLIIDDPDNFEEGYIARARKHGTAMASLIIHGDLNSNEPPIQRKLYVRPILKPDPNSVEIGSTHIQELIPKEILPVDLIYRAVRRMFEGEGKTPAVAPKVCIINFSVGFKDQLFINTLSPLARLIDWLSWKYRVLFIISAGNNTEDLTLEVDWDTFKTLSKTDQQKYVLHALIQDARNRKILQPAESINAITVGAAHDDASTQLPPRSIDPYASNTLPNVVSRIGLGFRRSIKPDILAPGGEGNITRRVWKQKSF